MSNLNTCLLDIVWILLGEVTCKSLLRVTNYPKFTAWESIASSPFQSTTVNTCTLVPISQSTNSNYFFRCSLWYITLWFPFTKKPLILVSDVRCMGYFVINKGNILLTRLMCICVWLYPLSDWFAVENFSIFLLTIIIWI